MPTHQKKGHIPVRLEHKKMHSNIEPECMHTNTSVCPYIHSDMTHFLFSKYDRILHKATADPLVLCKYFPDILEYLFYYLVLKLLWLELYITCFVIMGMTVIAYAVFWSILIKSPQWLNQYESIYIIVIKDLHFLFVYTSIFVFFSHYNEHRNGWKSLQFS